MHTRRFGRTEIQMPVFSTGGMRYQDGWADKPLAELDPKTTANMEAVIARSLEVGDSTHRDGAGVWPVGAAARGGVAIVPA